MLKRMPDAAKLTLGRLARLGIDFATNLIMMRQLGPAPFGLVAMASAIMAAFAAVSDAGVASSLVSDKMLSSARIGAATLCAVGLALATALVAALFAPVVVAVYSDPRLFSIWLVAAITLGLTPLSSVPQALAQREERFERTAFLPVLATALGAAIGIGLAQAQRDHWAIIARQTSTAAFTVCLFWLVQRPKMSRPARADLMEVLRFGRGVLGFDLVNALSRNADKFIVGRWLGDHALGLYTLGYRILTLPLSQVGAVATNLAYPRLSRLEKPEDVGPGLGAVMGNVAVITTPLCIGLALAAHELVVVLFGSAWSGAIFPFRILALLGVYQAPFAIVWLAYKVSRRTDAMARWALISTPPTVLSFAVGLPWGIEGVATSYALMSLALGVPLTKSAASVLNVRAAVLAGPALRGILRGTALALPLAGAYLLSRALQLPDAWVLAASGVTGAATEACLLLKMHRASRSSKIQTVANTI